MGGKGKEAAQRFLAIIVIIAMMTMMGIPPPVIVFFAIVIYFVWRAVQHTERHETNRIFDFYIAANDILRDEERRWYGFEIANVTREGERIMHEIVDAPPLVIYTLGALYHRAGDYGSAREHLAHLVESEAGDESRRVVASPELRRYVETLRRIERDPAEKPQAIAAVRSLERARRHHARHLLDHSATQLASAAAATHAQSPNRAPEPPLRREVEDAPSLLTFINVNANPAAHEPRTDEPSSATPGLLRNATAPHHTLPPEPLPDATHSSINVEPRAPITEVLRDLYEEEKKTA